eukprot:scaffold59011_cov17-Prasinocladus_malaysianus.AAC.1
MRDKACCLAAITVMIIPRVQIVEALSGSQYRRHGALSHVDLLPLHSNGWSRKSLSPRCEWPGGLDRLGHFSAVLVSSSNAFLEGLAVKVIIRAAI